MGRIKEFFTKDDVNEELLKEIKLVSEKVKNMEQEKHNKDRNEMLTHFKEVNEALDEIGLTVYTDNGEDIRKIMAVEILSRKYPFIKNYQQDLFIKTAADKSIELIEKKKKLLDVKR